MIEYYMINLIGVQDHSHFKTSCLNSRNFEMHYSIWNTTLLNLERGRNQQETNAAKFRAESNAKSLCYINYDVVFAAPCPVL
jgi:hypothetical protein